MLEGRAGKWKVRHMGNPGPADRYERAQPRPAEPPPTAADQRCRREPRRTRGASPLIGSPTNNNIRPLFEVAEGWGSLSCSTVEIRRDKMTLGRIQRPQLGSVCTLGYRNGKRTWNTVRPLHCLNTQLTPVFQRFVQIPQPQEP